MARLPRFVSTLLLVAVALWLMGLGGGQQEQSPIPIPDRSFTVDVTDRQGRSLEATRFTWEGNTFVKAQFGNASITLPFDKFSELKVGGKSAGLGPNQVAGTVTFKDGESIDVGIDNTSKCYGQTRFGTYEIFIKDIASIRFK